MFGVMRNAAEWVLLGKKRHSVTMNLQKFKKKKKAPGLKAQTRMKHVGTVCKGKPKYFSMIVRGRT